MRTSDRKNRCALREKTRFAPARSGFRNIGSKILLSSPKDQAGEFITETGRFD
jgi:hypothetical protein